MSLMNGFPETRVHSQEIIEKVLAYIGHDNMLALFDHFEERGLKRYEILDGPETFVKALKCIFGSGAEILENQIIMAICLKSKNVQYESGMTLVEAIRKLRDI